MNVFEISVKVFTLKEIPFNESSIYVTRFIDMCMAQNEKMREYHDAKCFKEYTFDNLFPLASKEYYEKNTIYNFRIRTINEKLAEYFLEKLQNFYNEDMKGLTVEIKKLPKRIIEKVFSLTPIVMKNDEGYWKYCMSFEKFEERLRANCMKKYNYFFEEKEKDNIPFYTNLIFKNEKPTPVLYKGITLRGDKVELIISPDEKSQQIAYMLLGTGLLENCTRGCGFLGYRFCD